MTPKRNKAPNKAYFKFAYFEYVKPNFETDNLKYWKDYFLDREISPKAPAYIKKAAETVAYANFTGEEKRLISYAERAEQDYLSQIAFIVGETEKKAMEKMEEKLREVEDRAVKEKREAEEQARKEDKEAFLNTIRALGEDSGRSFTMEEIFSLVSQKLDMDTQQ